MSHDPRIGPSVLRFLYGLAFHLLCRIVLSGAEGP